MKGKKTNEDFINEIRNIDFSMEAKNRDSEKIKLMDKVIQIQEEKTMKKSVFSKRGFAALLSMAVIFSTIAYGGQIVEYIKKQVTLGGYAQYNLYDEDGLAGLDFGEEAPVEFELEGRGMDDYTVTFKDLEEGAAYFTARLLTPEYIPEGYGFSYAQMYKGADGEADARYINLVYENGNAEILIMVRYLEEETRFETDLSENHEILDIRGYETLINGRTVDIVVDNVIYSYYFDDTAESVKMIESMFE